jgi:hypothetical protein
MLGKILFLVLTVISTVACDAFVDSSKTDSDVEDEKEYRLTKADRELIDRLHARDKEKRLLRRNPSRLIKMKSSKVSNSGFLNDFANMKKITFVNESSFDVANLKGKVTYFSEEKKELGTRVPTRFVAFT